MESFSLLFGILSLIVPVCNEIKKNTYIWNTLFSYCIVFILTLIGGVKNEDVSS